MIAVELGFVYFHCNLQLAACHCEMDTKCILI